jgi:hypothetical protein
MNSTVCVILHIDFDASYRTAKLAVTLDMANPFGDANPNNYRWSSRRLDQRSSSVIPNTTT